MTKETTQERTEPEKLSDAAPEAENYAMRDEERDQIDKECAEFQALMPGRIGAGEDLQTDPHMLTCERCRSLVRDLEYIAQAARDLMQVEEEPREDLWAKIQQAIENSEALGDGA